jgi:hypothetical protein
LRLSRERRGEGPGQRGQQEAAVVADSGGPSRGEPVIKQSENLKYVSNQLGHSSISVTVDRYADHIGGERRAARRLGERLALSSGNDPADEDVNASTRS